MKTVCASLSNMNIDSKKMLYNPKTISKNNFILRFNKTSDLRFDGVFFRNKVLYYSCKNSFFFSDVSNIWNNEVVLVMFLTQWNSLFGLDFSN